MKLSFKVLTKRVLPAILAVTLMATVGGCSKKGGEKGENVSTGTMPKNLTVWAPLGSLAAKAGANDRGDILAYKIIEEQTGCVIDWISPSSAEGLEKFNLLIAGDKLPDIICADVWSGRDTYRDIEEGLIVPISDYLDYMPNLKKFLEENPDVAKQFRNDDGSIHYLPSARGDEELTVFVGPTIRKDWLDKLGLEMPTNTDELYNVLKAFKTQDPNGNGKQDEIAFSGMGGDSWSYGIGNIVWAYDTHYSFFVKDGKITHGMLEEEMKPALEYLAKLYSEGLIDPDYLINDDEKYKAKILNDRSGFFFGIQPSSYYLTLNDGTKELVGVPYFDGKCYNEQYLNRLGGGQTVITGDCKDPAGAAMWLDYFFSPEGIIATNFGIEGETHNVVDGKRVLDHDYVFNNPDGLESKEVCHSSFIGASTDFPSVQLWEYYSQTLQPWGKAAIEVWSSSANPENALPKLKFTAEEKDLISDELENINTYVSTQFNNIIMGRASVNDLDKIKEELDNLGMQDVLKVYNDSYVRYLNK